MTSGPAECGATMTGGADDPTYLQLLHARLLDQGSPGRDSSALATMSSQEVNQYIRLRAGG